MKCSTLLSNVQAYFLRCLLRHTEKTEWNTVGFPYFLASFVRIFSKGNADVAKLVTALDLGSSAARLGGSSPSIRTTHLSANWHLLYNLAIKVLKEPRICVPQVTSFMGGLQ